MEIAAIKCNKDFYSLPSGPHKGKNLRAFFRVRDDHDLYLADTWTDSDDTLVPNDDTPVEVRGQMKFYTVSRKINGS